MAHRRLFLAYCSSQRELAEQYRQALAGSFDVLTWEMAQDNGRSILESTLNAIRRCAYGVALLSCDDPMQRGATQEMLPRDNVVFEAGLMLGIYGRGRTALVSVQAADGRWPKFPTDFSGILHETEPFTADAPCAASAERVALQLLSRNSDYVPTCSSERGDRRGFNVLMLDELRTFWHDFHGDFYCLNPSWQLELGNPDWLESHYRRYMDPQFRKASYIIDIDRGRSDAVDDVRHDGRRRLINPFRDLTGITSFVQRLVKQHPDVEKNLASKLHVHVRPGIRTEITTFVGSVSGIERAFMFVRRVSEDTVLEARSAETVSRQRARLLHLVGAAKGYRFDKLDDLRRRMLAA